MFVDLFKASQKCLHEKNILFHTFNLPEEHTLKVVLRGIPTDITEEEVKLDLENRGFKPTPIK